MSELHDRDDYNLKFDFIGPTKDVSFYEYMDSKELFNKLRNNQIRLRDGINKQKDFLKKLNEAKMGKKMRNKKNWLMILINFTILEKKLLIF